MVLMKKTKTKSELQKYHSVSERAFHVKHSVMIPPLAQTNNMLPANMQFKHHPNRGSPHPYHENSKMAVSAVHIPAAAVVVNNRQHH